LKKYIALIKQTVKIARKCSLLMEHLLIIAPTTAHFAKRVLKPYLILFALIVQAHCN